MGGIRIESFALQKKDSALSPSPIEAVLSLGGEPVTASLEEHRPVDIFIDPPQIGSVPDKLYVG